MPLTTDELVRITANTTVSLTKTREVAESKEIDVFAFVEGTEWLLPDFDESFRWSAWVTYNSSGAGGQHQPPANVAWMEVINPTGSISKPPVVGQRSEARIDLKVSTSGLRDRQGTPFVATVHLRIELPTPEEIPKQVLLLPISWSPPDCPCRPPARSSR